jgi:hypothetical protein
VSSGVKQPDRIEGLGRTGVMTVPETAFSSRQITIAH